MPHQSGINADFTKQINGPTLSQQEIDKSHICHQKSTIMDSFQSALESTKALAKDAMGAIDQRMSSLGFHSEEMDQSHQSRRSRFSLSSSSSSLSIPESPTSRRSITSSRVDPPERFRGAFEALAMREDDVRLIFEQEGGLESLKKSLRQQGAVTNALVKQGLHLYVREQKMDKAKFRRVDTR